MKKIIQLTTCILFAFFYRLSAQNIDSLILACNNNIAPKQLLESIESISFRKNISILTHSGVDMKSTKICTFFSSGEAVCIDSLTQLPLPKVAYLNEGLEGLESIKYELGYIPRFDSLINNIEVLEGDSELLVLQISNLKDGSLKIYKIDPVKSTIVKRIDFNSKYPDLGKRETNVINYNRVNGVLIPQAISYVNNMVIATIVYEDVVITYKNGK
ncbi:hypothetical protein QWY31_03455 [Cytophagales bacterium LB-30]|uniref:Uncharacterized protein n=1 Tax=Shiella aurantiaca TaxID=3058365 RepID=A0ABT8F3G6_9BACT|nr:hypothetical protein [Shiella aurantiaca]MDN4164541.1 hypothetical protein [Shiella aurantiaca]